MIAPGVAGAVDGVMLPVVDAGLVPQAVVTVTDTLPGPEPIVIVAEGVFCPAVTAHPVPITDHVYAVAPETEGMLYVLPVDPAHSFIGRVNGPGGGGVLLTTIVAVLLLLIVLLQMLLDTPEPLARLVTVMVELPGVVKPVAVNVPVPAVVTVIVAVNPIAAGLLRL